MNINFLRLRRDLFWYWEENYLFFIISKKWLGIDYLNMMLSRFAL